MVEIADKINSFGKAKSLKRKSNDADLNSNLDLESQDPDLESASDQDDCDTIRHKIRNLLETGDITIKAWLAELDVSGGAYYRFTKQHGKHSGHSSVFYEKAVEYFEKREGKQPSKSRKKRTAVPAPSQSSTANMAHTDKSGGESDEPALAPSKANSSARKSATDIPLTDFTGIELDGEEDDVVSIFDSCDEIRRKINAYLRKPSMTRTHFLRDLHAQFQGPRKPKTMSCPQLATFLGQKGPVTGNQTNVYYAAYVFFEKQRLAARKPKTQHREDMEDAWWMEDGVDVTINLKNVRYIGRVGMSLGINKFGKPFTY
ncbi:hypothetical protein BT63DRAFT_374032 [Microthyrium microscopicum]|uniref:DUF7726 domain-containing protein n=1 Tax=Microthyrium microscopicum TaxID=703497 RepID=A0A6A6UC22_9PEZI|nr:hypothetical protein BT63DRAFT_374032 [Microthyrium microscopicum]